MAGAKKGVLYIVGSPIGNLGDITLRALETLKSVELVACEDTRRTHALLTHFSIHAKLTSVRAANEKFAAGKVIERLKEGASCAYLSDAGTPAVSDPGAALVKEVLGAGFEVVPIPGVSALTCLLSAAGEAGKPVVFEGFLSPKDSRRRRRVGSLMESGDAFVVYESPFRVVKLLRDIADCDSGRFVCIGREMTKLHEEFVRGSALEVFENFEKRAEARGEFAIYIGRISVKETEIP